MYDPNNDGTGEHVAVKALKQVGGVSQQEGWMKEIDILKSLYHANIVKYKGCCTEHGENLESGINCIRKKLGINCTSWHGDLMLDKCRLGRIYMN